MSPGVVGAFVRTVAVAGAAATAVAAVAVLFVTLRQARARRWLGTAVALTFAVPGSALAVALLLAYGSWLRDTLLLVFFAYVAKFWALGHRTVAGTADAVPAEGAHAARVSGADARTAMRSVVLPPLRPAIGAAWLVVFLFGLHELTMSSLLYGPGSVTMAVVILGVTELGDVTITSALAVLLTSIVAALAIALAALRMPRRWLA